MELPRAFRQGKLVLIVQHFPVFLASALLGFGINTISMLVIKHTGAVTLKVMGAARNAGLVLFSVVVLGEASSMTQLVGYGASLCFFALYNYYKMNNL